MNRTVLLWFVVGWIGFLILPWYVIEDGFWGLEWVLDGYPFDTDYGPAWAHLLEGEKVWLAPIPLFLLLPLLTRGRIKSRNPSTGSANFFCECSLGSEFKF